MIRRLAILCGLGPLLLCVTPAAAQEEEKELREARTFATDWSVRGMALNPAGTRVVVCNSPAYTGIGHVAVHDFKTGKELFVLKGHTDYAPCAAYAPNGKWIVTGSADKTLKVWDAEKGTELRTLKGSKGGVTDVAVTPDSRHIVAGVQIMLDKDKYERAGELRVWNAATGKLVWTVDGLAEAVWCVAISPDGKTIASGSLDHTVTLWESATGKRLRVLKGHKHYVYGVAFSPDGKRIASVSQDGKLIVWDAATGERQCALEVSLYTVQSVAFSPDGTRIATGGLDGQVRLWDARSGWALATGKVRNEGVNVVTFTPDGKSIVSGNNNVTVSVWTLEKR